MGISSNQARLMTLTARQHDLELRAQQISAEKMVKTMNSQQMATDYSDALSGYSLLKSAENAPGDTFTYENGSFKADENGVLDKDDLIDAILDDINGKGYAAYNSEDFLRLAQADYDKESAKLSAEEKQLDLELTQINTEHSAVTTEYDSVKSLIKDNTDKSFNLFG